MQQVLMHQSSLKKLIHAKIKNTENKIPELLT